jgi:hypothetical protein
MRWLLDGDELPSSGVICRALQQDGYVLDFAEYGSEENSWLGARLRRSVDEPGLPDADRFDRKLTQCIVQAYAVTLVKPHSLTVPACDSTFTNAQHLWPIAPDQVFCQILLPVKQVNIESPVHNRSRTT